MTYTFQGPEPNFDELRLTIYFWVIEAQGHITQKLFKDVLKNFKSQGCQLLEMVESFVIAAEKNYCDTSEWVMFHSSMQPAGDRPRPREASVQAYDDLFRACQSEGLNLIELLDAFTGMVWRIYPLRKKNEEECLELMDVICEQLIDFRGLQTDSKYNFMKTVETIPITQELALSER